MRLSLSVRSSGSAAAVAFPVIKLQGCLSTGLLLFGAGRNFRGSAELIVRGIICSGSTGVGMAYKDIFWMACDSTEQLRAEYGPFHSREEAELEARKLGFGYLLRYEHILGPNEEIEEVRCVFVELPGATPVGVEAIPITLHTRCATCGESAAHEKGWQAEVWADIHEFEHSRHRVRLFEHARGKGLKEIGDWRG